MLRVDSVFTARKEIHARLIESPAIINAKSKHTHIHAHAILNVPNVERIMTKRNCLVVEKKLFRFIQSGDVEKE